jgi:hypothetical protein
MDLNKYQRKKADSEHSYFESELFNQRKTHVTIFD